MLWEYGGYASEGVKQVAELGSPVKMEEEIRQQVRTARNEVRASLGFTSRSLKYAVECLCLRRAFWATSESQFLSLNSSILWLLYAKHSCRPVAGMTDFWSPERAKGDLWFHTMALRVENDVQAV